MNILLLSYNDWGAANFNLAAGINKYTQHTARSITEVRHPFHYDTDIVLSEPGTSENIQEVNDLIQSADFFCINQAIPDSIYNRVVPRINLFNFYMLFGGSDIRNVADAIFSRQLHKNDFFWSFTAYDFSMTRCIIQSFQHDSHIIDVDRWQPDTSKLFDNKSVMIYHSPTNNKIKGTEYIQKAIKHLSKKYPFVQWTHTGCERDGSGGKPWAEVMEGKRRADIFIDSIEFHEHGQNTAEAMAFGIPVLNRLSHYYLALYPDTPIINTNKNNIQKNLEWLIRNPEKRREIGKKTREYCVNMFSIQKFVARWQQAVEFIVSLKDIAKNEKKLRQMPTYWQEQIKYAAKGKAW